jgi:hypothetical protein
MNEKKSRTLLFILGISIGIVVGAGAMYITTPKQSISGDVSENSIEQIVNKVFELVSLKRSEIDSTKSLKDATPVAKANKVVNEKLTDAQTKRQQIDSINIVAAVKSEIDSTLADSTTKNFVDLVQNSEDIVVKKDELIATKAIEIVNMDYANDKAGDHVDSVLQEVSGIRDNSKLNEAKSVFQVELWKSPINYRGYRLSKNKLVVFGISGEASLKLIQFNDYLYLKHNDLFYKIESYSDFKAFEKIVNTQLLMSLAK